MMMESAVGRFLGGSPVIVAVRLIVVSFVAGLVLVTFGYDPASLFGDAVRAVRRIVDLGFTDVRQVGRILLTGAMVVVPVWLALRLFDSRGRRRLGPAARASRRREAVGLRLDLTAARRADPLRCGVSSKGQMLMAFSHPLARGAKVWTARAQDGSEQRVLVIITTIPLDPGEKGYKKSLVERLSRGARDYLTEFERRRLIHADASDEGLERRQDVRSARKSTASHENWL